MRSAILLFLFQNPPARFHQMPCHGGRGFPMAFAFQPLVKLPDMLLAVFVAMRHGGIGGFHQRPFQIVIGLLRSPPVVCFAAAGMHGRHQSGIGRQMCGGWESLNVSDLLFHSCSTFFLCPSSTAFSFTRNARVLQRSHTITGRENKSEIPAFPIPAMPQRPLAVHSRPPATAISARVVLHKNREKT
jgi:hypothetical protein